jgi:hypothetical protein
MNLCKKIWLTVDCQGAQWARREPYSKMINWLGFGLLENSADMILVSENVGSTTRGTMET